MKNKAVRIILVGLLVTGVVAAPGLLHAQQSTSQSVDGLSIVGSVLLSVLHVPLKLLTCVGTQTGAALAYTSTFGVAGNYDGGTNGKQIGEVANRSCTGDWIITPAQVHTDYQ
jgi:hypothetical protein